MALVSLLSARITKALIEQDGPEWRDKLPEIPVVPLSVQQQHREKPVSIELAQARAARAAQEEGRLHYYAPCLQPTTDTLYICKYISRY